MMAMCGVCLGVHGVGEAATPLAVPTPMERAFLAFPHCLPAWHGADSLPGGGGD